MGWDPDTVPNPQDPETFASAKLDWTEQERPEQARLLNIYRELIALRRENKDLHNPDFTSVSVDFDEDQRWLVLHRGGTAVTVNFADSERDIPVAAKKVLLSTEPGEAIGNGTVTLPAYGAAILQV
jgi:maltooligosyltrehalose trehalohydrolase